MYDWANSVYSLAITSAIFPVYYTSVTKSETSDLVYFLGREFKNTALYSYALSAAYLIIVFASPLLSGIADYSGTKKSFLKFFCWLGSAACTSLYFFTGSETLNTGIFAFMIATIGWAGSIVFYNAYLPEIAPRDRHDRISARGFAMGYIGSSIHLIFCLVMILQPGWFGITQPGQAPRISFIITGIWWAAFAAITFNKLPKDIYNRIPSGNVLLKGYRELIKVWNELKSYPRLTSFLLAFFFFNMGVQTVMYVATLFGDKELKLEASQLITTILIIQFVAIGGAHLFAWMSGKIGNVKSLTIAVIAWIAITVYAYFIYSASQFYVAAFSVGMVMGGIQALSRSTYSKMLPETHDHASYFSFYDVCEKAGLVIGTASYGLIEELTGSMRNSVIVLTTFFFIGLLFLSRVKYSKAQSAPV